MTEIIFWIVIVTVIISEAHPAANKTSNATPTEISPRLNGSEILSSGNNNDTDENQPPSQNNVFKPSSENTEWTRRYKLDKYTPDCTSGNCSKIVSSWNCTCKDGYELNIRNACNPICERQCVNGKRVAPDTCTCDEGFQRFQDDVFTCEPKCSESCIFGNCTAPNFCTCDKGYEISSWSKFTCAPVCNETCVFGMCKSPNTCVCNDGWEGDSCNKTTLLCGVPEPIRVNSVIEKSNLTESNSTKSTNENLQIKPDALDCRRECLDQLSTISVNFTRKILNMTYNFIPIDSSCNIIVADSNSVTNSKNIIGAVCGILLSVIIIYVAYIVIKRMEKRKKFINDPTGTWHNDYEELISINETN